MCRNLHLHQQDYSTPDKMADTAHYLQDPHQSTRPSHPLSATLPSTREEAILVSQTRTIDRLFRQVHKRERKDPHLSGWQA